MILSFVLLFPAHTRKSCPSITCRAGYYAVHLLRKYTTMLGFLLLLFPAHTRKSCRLRVSRTSCVLIFSYVNLSPYLITFGDGLRLHHASALHDRIRSEKPNASFAVAWFLSSLQRRSRNEMHSGSCRSLLFVILCILFVDLEHVQLACQLI